MADFIPDGNTWYWITETRVNYTSALFYNGNGDVYFAANDTKSNGMYWQIYTLPDGSVQFRNRNSNTLKQLGVCYNAAEVSPSKTQPCMNASDSSGGQQWNISPWGDGSFKIENVDNGTAFNLDWHPGGPGFLSPTTAETPKQPAQHWLFSSIGLVEDGLYSTSIEPSSASASATAASTTVPSASASATQTSVETSTASDGSVTTSTSAASLSQKSSSSGISGGAAAGIGIGVAVAVIGLAVLAFFLVKRRSKTAGAGAVQELPGNAVQGRSYEKIAVAAPVHEAPTNAPSYELYTAPSELPTGEQGGYKR